MQCQLVVGKRCAPGSEWPFYTNLFISIITILSSITTSVV